MVQSLCLLARVLSKQKIDPRLNLRYMGVPTHAKSYMLGGNKSVVDIY